MTPNKYLSLALILVGLLALSGLIWILIISPPPVKTQENKVQKTGTTAPIAMTSKDISIQESTSTYKISAKYPEFSGLGDASAGQWLNDSVEAEVNARIAEFKKEASSYSPEEVANFKNMDLPSSQEDIAYQLVYSGRNMVSIKFSNYTYFQGAAHPTEFFWTDNYDLSNRKTIELKNLFKPGTDYLQLLKEKSTLQVRQNLKKMGVDEEIVFESGLDPREDNYDVFVLDKEKITLIFNIYQVAPYVAGPQSAELRYDSLPEFNLDYINNLITGNN